MSSPHGHPLYPVEDPLTVHIMDRLMYLEPDLSRDIHPVMIAENLVFYLRYKYGPIPDPTVLHFPITHVKGPDGLVIRKQLSVVMRLDAGKIEVPMKVVAVGEEKLSGQLNNTLNELITPLVI